MFKKFKYCLLFYIFLSNAWTQEIDSTQFLGVNILGNNKTKERVISREIPWAIGAKVALGDSAYFVQRIHDNIYNIGLFNFVTVQWSQSGQGFYLIIEVQERGFFWAYPLMELADPNLKSWWQQPNRWSRISLGLEAQLKNIAGLNQRLFIFAQAGYRNKIGFHYKIPFLFGHKNIGWQMRTSFENKKELRIGLENHKRVFLNEEKVLFQKWMFYTDFYIRPQLYQWYTLSLGYENILLQPGLKTIENEALSYANQMDILGTQLKYEWDKRDLKFYSRKGHYISLESEQFFDLDKGIDLISMKLRAYGVYHLPFFRKWFWSQSLKYFYNATAHQDYYWYDGLGYQDNLRGFETVYFDAFAYLINRNQLSYLVYKNDYISVPFIKKKQLSDLHLAIFFNGFFETGYAMQNAGLDKNPYSNTLLMSTGLGIDFATYYDRTFRLECSYNSLHQVNFNIHYKQAF